MAEQMFDTTRQAQITFLVRESRQDQASRRVLADYLADQADANVILTAIELMLGEAQPHAKWSNFEVAIKLLPLTHVERRALIRAARAIGERLDCQWHTLPLTALTNITEQELRSTSTVGKKTLARLRSGLGRAGLALKGE